MTPKQSIRAMCRQCVCDEYREIDSCSAKNVLGPKGCALWPHRHGEGFDAFRGDSRISALKAIKKECLNCMGYTGKNLPSTTRRVRECESADCPLHPYRLGKNPNRAGIGNFNFRKRR